MADFNVYPALDTYKPDWGNILSQTAQTQQTNITNQFLGEELGARNDLAKMQNDAFRLQQSNTAIRDAASKAEDADDFDERMRTLQAQGYPEAGQYIGKYTPKMRGRILSGFAAPGATLGGGGLGGAAPTTQRQENQLAQEGATGGGGGGGLSPSQIHDIGKMNPDQVRSASKRTNDIMESMNRIASSLHPAQAWEDEKKRLVAMGYDDIANIGPYNPQGFMAQYNQLAAKQQLLSQTLEGIDVPRAPLEHTQIGGEEYTYDPFAQDPSQAYTPGPHSPNYQYVGTEKGSGKPIYHDTRGNQDILGPYAVGEGRYNTGSERPVKGTGSGPGGKLTVAERYGNRWADLHRNDPEYKDNPDKLEADALAQIKSFSTKQPRYMTDAEIDIQAARMTGAIGGTKKDEDAFRAELRADRDRDSASGATSRPNPPARGATGKEPPANLGYRKAPDGQWYRPDPAHPGQYLRWRGQ
jgi:hypothetical protein